MTLITVETNLGFFQKHFGCEESAQEIARRVLASKPSRPVDLHMAAFDLEQALIVVSERKFELVSPYSDMGIP